MSIGLMITPMMMKARKRKALRSGSAHAIGLGSPGPRGAFVHECHWPWPSHVARFYLRDVKSRLLYEARYRTIQVASPGDALPNGCQTVLPFTDSIFWRQPMFDEEQFPVRLENPAHLCKCSRHIWNTTQCPRRHDRIDAGVVEGN